VVYESQKHRSDIIILDAQNLEKGPLAQLHLQHHIPYGLHGSWSPNQQLGMG
jgi:all-trans-8'-apo-beta-carotenal 15,15'-oxygenase